MLLLVFSAALVALVNGLENVTISHLSDLGAVAHRIALDKGYYSQLGLNVDMIWYPSSGAQLDDQESWDFGTTDMGGSIIGGMNGLIGVGIAADESATTQFVATAEAAAKWPPETGFGNLVCVEPNSTEEYVIQNCLRAQGFEDAEFISMYTSQADCVAAMTPIEGENGIAIQYGGLRSPYIYQLLETGAETLCSGRDIYTTIVGGHVVREDFANDNPLLVAQVLAGWLRAVEFINNDVNKEEVLNYTAVLFEEAGAVVPREYLELEVQLTGLFELQKQLGFMERRGEPPLSNYDIWVSEVINYMVGAGTLNEDVAPNPPSSSNAASSSSSNAASSLSSTYIDDQYMLRVSTDAYLNPWANGVFPPITETIAARPDLSTFLELLQLAELYSPLAGKAQFPYTIFAPSNDAFEMLDPELVATLTSPEGKDQLTEIFNYHITDTEGIIRSVDLAEEGQITMRNNENATLCGNPPMIDYASILNADVLASNGVIHVIDQVLLPPSLRGDEELNVTCLDGLEMETEEMMEANTTVVGDANGTDMVIGNQTVMDAPDETEGDAYDMLGENENTTSIERNIGLDALEADAMEEGPAVVETDNVADSATTATHTNAAPDAPTEASSEATSSSSAVPALARLTALSVAVACMALLA